MERERNGHLIAMITELNSTLSEQPAKKLELDKCNRMIHKLSSFAPDCEQCAQYLIEMEIHFLQNKDQLAQLDEAAVKHHKHFVNAISTHLMKEHKLVTSGLYMSIFMSIGTSLGVVFGLLVFDNIGLGLPLGIGIGVAVGAALDADAKKRIM